MHFLCCCKSRISYFYPIFRVCLGGNTKGQKHTVEGKMEGDAQLFHIKTFTFWMKQKFDAIFTHFCLISVHIWRQLLTEVRWSVTERFCFGHSLLNPSDDPQPLCAFTCCRRNSFFCIIYRCSVEFPCSPDHWPSGTEDVSDTLILRLLVSFAFHLWKVAIFGHTWRSTCCKSVASH